MSFSVVLNSTSNYNSVGSGGNKSSLQFAIDWQFLPEGKYKMGYNFISRPTTANDVYYLQIPDLGANMNSYTAAKSTTTTTNGILGLAAQWYGQGTVSSCLFSNYMNSPPIYLANKPRANVFTVNILNYDGSAYTNGGSWTNFDYLLILYFEKIDE
jgi:hypothetical protein